VVSAATLLAVTRLALWLLPFRLVHRAAAARRRVPSGRCRARATVPAERIVWAVGAASRVVPRSTCLVRALAARRLLGRHGHPSELRLGVARGADGAFEAHAWLEQDGRVLIGGPVEQRFAPLPSLEGRL
jgi:hypothetical protein